MTFSGVLFDFGVAGILILIGQLIRAKFKPAQQFFVPSCLIAGFLGLMFGKQFFNILPFSDFIGTYSGQLITVVFAAIGINGFKMKKGQGVSEFKRFVNYLSYKQMVYNLEIIVPVVFTILVISKIAPDINYGFGILLAAGFVGGHGTAAAVGNTFNELGFTAATDLGMTVATVGIVSGIIGGLIFIKWATKRGYTGYIKDFAFISGDLKTGLISKDNRKPLAMGTVSSIALDPLAFHASLLLAASALGMKLSAFAGKFGLIIPSFVSAFIIGIIFFVIFGGANDTSVYKYVDKNMNSRISGAATDFLVFFGVAAIKVAVVVEYALPLVLLLLCGTILTVCMMRYVGPVMNKKSWFERSIFVYGYATGVFAIGFTLLRIVDPDNESKTLNDTALCTPFGIPIEILTWTLGPVMLLNGKHWQFVGLYTLMTIGFALLPTIFKTWVFNEPLAREYHYSEESISDVGSQNIAG